MADISLIRSGAPLSFGQQLKLTAQLSWPAMMAQLSSIMMQYIDAAMVGRLGADDSAAVGLVSTSLWLFWGICSAVTVGFSVQVAHRIGASDHEGARRILRQSIVACLLFAFAVVVVGVAIAWPLPRWLGGTEAVCPKASIYFLVFVLALPLLTMNYLGGAMLRCVGNMKVPGGLNVMMCVLDVVFNFFLIFPTHEFHVAGIDIRLPGAGLGVLGAALGTVSAEIVTAGSMMWYLCTREKSIRLVGHPGSFRPTRQVLSKALRVSAPMTLEHAVICGAQIAVTVIVAPLGVMAIAANAFAVTAESICYMPGYGIGDAATTLVGKSYGAGDVRLCSVGDGTDESRGGDSVAWSGGLAHRGVGRADVCSGDSELWCHDWCRRYCSSRIHEFRQHMACEAADSGVARPDHGACWSLARDVCRALFPWRYIPLASHLWRLAEERHLILLNYFIILS